jgi:DNA helicase-2/ATP-dependent DNA helicase PcrA
MTGHPLVSRALAAELAGLNDDQRTAVREPGSVVVRAGPGSGKTRTLVAKVGYLLQTQVPSRRGVAAITYTRSAAREIDTRLGRLGIHPGWRLTATTVHGWCLNSILGPYGALAGMPTHEAVVDDTSDEWRRLLQRCLDDAYANADAARAATSITTVRRRLAAGLDVDLQDPYVQAARDFDARMLERRWLDFDLMTAQALRLVRENRRIAHLVAARFPWVLVDEYQDLGPVLHELVRHLHDVASVRVAAFGDGDQTVMGFTGADPRYLNALADHDDFRDITLRLNYRCGQAIVAASQAALNEQRHYRARPDRNDPGIIDLVPVTGGLEAHGAATVTAIGKYVSQGVPPHQIVVLYPGRGPLLNALDRALLSSPHDFVRERDQRLPDGDLADFIRECAARSVMGSRGAGDPALAVSAVSLPGLVREYARLRRVSGLPALPGYGTERLVANVLAKRDRWLPEEEPLGPWLASLARALGLDAIAEAGPDQRDQAGLSGFQDAARLHMLTVADVAAGTVRVGKVTLTTYHSAKGREWDVVIMPGLVDGIMPGRWGRSGVFTGQPRHLSQDRRAFYVGVTRATNAIVLIYPDPRAPLRGVPFGDTSPFVRDILYSLDSP